MKIYVGDEIKRFPGMKKLSLLVPTMGGENLKNLLASISETTANLDDLEIVLGFDEGMGDDQPRCGLLKIAYSPKGSRVVEILRKCFAASTGQSVMLMNDDVIVRTDRWDELVYGAIDKYPDGIYLIGVNDLIFGEFFFTFPIISRKFLETFGLGPEYKKYKTDDRILFIYAMLRRMGGDRISYLPDVVFEHLNFRIMDQRRVYQTPDNDANPENHKAWLHDKQMWFENINEVEKVATTLRDFIKEGRGL
jgi:hypothetical protein